MTTTTAALPMPPGDPDRPGDPANPGPLVTQILAELAGGAPFLPIERFIRTGFAVRLLAVLEHVMATGTWMIVTALPGDGKSTTLDHFIGRHAAHWVDGEGGQRVRIVPVLATRVSRGVGSADRLMVALAHGLGAVPNLRAYQFRDWLVGAIVRAGVRMIAIDDAHELTMGQLSYLRELTDQLASRGHRVAIVLLAASATTDPRAGNPWRLVAANDLVAEQFRRRLNGPDPIVHVAGLSRPEVGRVLKTWEVLYHERFPELELARWTGSVFHWLTDERNDTAGSGRVRMKHLADVVDAALALAWAEARPGLRADGMDLYHAALRLTVRGFTHVVLDVELGLDGTTAA